MLDSIDTTKIVKRLIREVNTPMLLDADALNSIGKRDLKREVIITPHLVEMERISGVKRSDILKDRLEFVKTFSSKNSCVSLLKGAGTVISSSKGELTINTTGNAGMAVAGSGDVLSGIIGGFVAQGFELYEAACGGAYLHGLAGDIAAEEKGIVSLLATDIVKCIPKALLSMEAGKNE